MAVCAPPTPASPPLLSSSPSPTAVDSRQHRGMVASCKYLRGVRGSVMFCSLRQRSERTRVMSIRTCISCNSVPLSSYPATDGTGTCRCGARGGYTIFQPRCSITWKGALLDWRGFIALVELCQVTHVALRGRVIRIPLDRMTHPKEHMTMSDPAFPGDTVLCSGSTVVLQ